MTIATWPSRTLAVAGLEPGAVLIVNTAQEPGEVSVETGWEGRLICIDGTRLAAEHGLKFANVVMLGAVAAALGEPPLEPLLAAVSRLLGRKGADPAPGVLAGYGAVTGREAAWAR